MAKQHKDEKNEFQSGSEPITLTPESVIVEAGEADADPPRPDAAPGIVRPEDAPSGEADTLRSEIERLNSLLQEREKEVAELKDKYLRTLADQENARRRIRQQSDGSVRLQKENLLRDILPIMDNLERAVDAARGGGNGKSIVEGVEMVLASMRDLLKQQGVTAVESVGKQFDPIHHEAIDHVPSEVHPPNTVVQEFHRGYQIGDRVLRPARVVVAAANSPRNRSEGES